MISIQYIPLDNDDVDVKKTFEFDGVVFKLRLRKNNQDDYFSIDVFDASDVFIYNSRLTYKYIFVDSIQPDLPFQVIPFDPTELLDAQLSETAITDDNLGDTVKLLTSIGVS